MISQVLVLLSLMAFVTAINATTTDCPSCDATACSYRSVWSILASCGLTLLICVWHAIHPDIPLPHWKWHHVLLHRIFLVLRAFFALELLMLDAFSDWMQARKIKETFCDKGYEWTMTHSHFVHMGGFVYYDNKRNREISADEFMRLVKEKEIVNPMIKIKDIQDKSTSDWLGKAILIVQLCWFTLQIVARGANHLAVTLIELDTACMAVLTVPLFLFWWDKPLGCQRPHIFYSPDVKPPEDPEAYLLTAFKEEPNRISAPHLFTSTNEDDSEKPLVRSEDNAHIHTEREWMNLIVGIGQRADDDVSLIPLFGTWFVLGGLHLIAWNFEFPTVAEKITCCVACFGCLTSALFPYWTSRELCRRLLA